MSCLRSEVFSAPVERKEYPVNGPIWTFLKSNEQVSRIVVIVGVVPNEGFENCVEWCSVW